MDEIRHEDPTRKPNDREKFKLSLRKANLERLIWRKRNPEMTIKGYDLSKYKKKKKKPKKTCWCCGSARHLISSCRIHKESLLRRRVSELERRVEELEAMLAIRNQYRKKIEKKKEKKKAKKKKKRHQLKVQAMNTAVKVRNQLLKEEQTWNGSEWLKGAQLIEKEPPKIKQEICKAYKNLYNRDLNTDIVEAATCGDEFFEWCENEPPGRNKECLIESFQPDHKNNIERPKYEEDIDMRPIQQDQSII